MVAATTSTLALLLIAVASSSCEAVSNLRHSRQLEMTYQQTSDYETALLQRVNEERAKYGLSALCCNKKLQKASQRHSDDQASKDYMDHTGSDGSSMSERITDAGYDWSAVAENVAAGQVDVDAVMDAWMNSEGHRHNIMGDYTMMGIAYAYNADGTYKHYWTQDFGTGENEQCDGSDDTQSPATEAPTTQTPAPETPAPTTQLPDQVEQTEATEAPETPCPETEAPETLSTDSDVVQNEAETPQMEDNVVASPPSGGCEARM